MSGKSGVVRSQSRRIAPKKVSAASRPPSATSAVQDRRLVQPEALNEERRMGDDRATVRALADDAARALAGWASRRAARTRLLGRRAGQVRGGLVAQRVEHRRDAGRIGSVERGEREVAPPAAQACSRIGIAAAPMRVGALSMPAGKGTSGRRRCLRAAPRASRSVGEQATRPGGASAGGGAAGRPAVARVSACADYPGARRQSRAHETPTAARRAAPHGPRRRPRARPLPRAGRAVVHADLADLGADVIKIERPGTRRRHARLGPAVPEGHATATTPPRPPTTSAPTATSARSRSTSPRPKGRRWCATLARALPTCSSRTSRSATWRATASTTPRCARCNPRLVYCSITGFGQTGPYRDRAGYDYVIQGMGGLMSVTGERDDAARAAGRRRSASRSPTCSPACTRRVAILAALRHRERTGEGQAIDMALLDTQVAMLANLGANYLVERQGAAARRQRAPEHRALPGVRGAPTAHLILAVGNDGQFAQVLRRRRPAASCASDPRFARNAGPRAQPRRRSCRCWRRADADARAARLAGGARGGQGAVRRRSTTSAEVFADPQVRARGMTVDAARIRSPARCALVASPIKLSATPVRYRRAPPLLGSTPTRCWPSSASTPRRSPACAGAARSEAGGRPASGRNQ